VLDNNQQPEGNAEEPMPGFTICGVPSEAGAGNLPARIFSEIRAIFFSY
jgi:hypothetical protein